MSETGEQWATAETGSGSGGSNWGTESETGEWAADSTGSSSSSGAWRSGVVGSVGALGTGWASPGALGELGPPPELAFPSLFVTERWTLLFRLPHGVELELGVCGGFRLVCADAGLSVFVGCGAKVLGVNSPEMRLLRLGSRAGTRAVGQLGPVVLAMGPEGVSFGSLEEPGRGYFTSDAALMGTAMFSADRADWANVGKKLCGDGTPLNSALFEQLAFHGEAAKAQLAGLLQRSHHHSADGRQTVHLGVLRLSQDAEGCVSVRTTGPRPVSVRLSPESGTLRLRFPCEPPQPPPPKTSRHRPQGGFARQVPGKPAGGAGGEAPVEAWVERGEGAGLAWAAQKLSLRRRWFHVRDGRTTAALSPNALLTTNRLP